MASENSESIYVSPESAERVEKVSKIMTKLGVSGLYHSNGKVNKSALFAYMLQKFEKLLEESAKKVEK